jgi:hypothetical protein
MDVRLQVAILAGVVTALGWLVTHILSRIADRRKSRREFLLAYTTKQLAELYGPLAFLVLEGQRSWEDLKYSLDVHNLSIFQPAYSPESSDDLKTWLFWAEKDFMPRNRRIRDLLSSNTYLIEGERMPDSYRQFLEHYKSWEINHLRWREEGIAYPWRSRINWPPDFSSEVLDTFYRLKQRHWSLVTYESPKATIDEDLPSRVLENQTRKQSTRLA